MIDCNEAVEQLWQYLEQELEDEHRTQVEEHLALCRRCCGEMEFAEEMRRFMARRPDVEIPAAVISRFEDVIAGLEVDETR